MEYEKIFYKSNLPVKIFTQAVEFYPYHWHEDPEILFVLSGEVEIRVGAKDVLLRNGDVFFVNSNELHFVRAVSQKDRTEILAMQMNHRYLESLVEGFNEKVFYIDPSKNHLYTPSVVNNIKKIIATIMDLVLNESFLYELKTKKQLIDLITILIEHFETESQSIESEEKKDMRVLKILQYMSAYSHHSELSLGQVADHFFMNSQYLSRYFKEKVGNSFKKKLDHIRLLNSLKSLETSTKSIAEIALTHGFPDSKSYYRVFKEIFHTTPGEYRSNYIAMQKMDISKDYLNVNSVESLRILFDYSEVPNATINVAPTTRDIKRVDLFSKGREFIHTFTNLLTFGHASLGLRQDFQEQLTLIQSDIGFKYARFHDIFSDRLQVYNVREDGTVYFNFQLVDTLFDLLLSKGLKPFIELGFMPEALAKKKESIFTWSTYVSPPKEIKNWVVLIDTFITHLINRYGEDEVETWYFEFWNEPEVPYFWRGSEDEFFKLYEATYMKMKSIHPKLRVGGFSTIHFGQYEAWIERFKHCVDEEVGLDFHTFHIYNFAFNPKAKKRTAPIEMKNAVDVTQFKSLMIGDVQNFTKKIDNAISKIDSQNTLSKEIWITEWNANSDHKDPLHDTTYMAAFIVRAVLENMEKVQGMGYWTFTDLFEEFPREPNEFHGGFGLLTQNGIKKPGYHAFRFLDRLGESILYQEDGVIVTKRGKNFQILLYHYVHPNELYRSFDYSQLSLTRRYDVFPEKASRLIQLVLTSTKGSYRIKRSILNRKNGSAFDAWVDMGAPLHLDEDLIHYLKSKSEPRVSVETIDVQDEWVLEEELSPHEIRLIELTRLV